jgi:uncharacterized protein YdaU (DUF1376 family)
MNYYPHHIGDFNSATRHLTRMERGIYRDMRDLYFEKEQPLLADKRRLYRLLLIVTPEEIEAADQVLADFFVLTDEGWFNEACAAEIQAYKDNQRNANAGGRKKAWMAEERRIREDIATGDITSAERRLVGFVQQYGDIPESLALSELLVSLKNPPQSGLDFGHVAGGESFATTVEPGCNRDATAIEPGGNRDATGVQSRLANAESNQNQNQNQNKNHVNPVIQPTLIEDPARGAVALSVEFRRHGVRTQPADPRLLEMAGQGVTVATVAAACEEGKRTKGDQLNLGYVVSILARWSREAAAMNVAGARTQKSGHTAGFTAARAATIAGLTGEGPNDRDDNIIDITPRAASHQLG